MLFLRGTSFELTHDGQHRHEAYVELATQLALGGLVDHTRRLLLTDTLGDGVVDDTVLLVVLEIHGEAVKVSASDGELAERVVRGSGLKEEHESRRS